MEYLTDGLIWFANKLIATIGGLIEILLFFLPDTPFQSSAAPSDSGLLGYAAWVLPISEFIPIVAVFVTAIGVYYLYRTALRWLKVARS